MCDIIIVFFFISFQKIVIKKSLQFNIPELTCAARIYFYLNIPFFKKQVNSTVCDFQSRTFF